MLSDYHIHTCFSGDSQTPPEEQVKAAAALGMEEICFTDHHDYGSKDMTRIDFTLDIPAYLPAIRALKEQYEGRIRIFTGIELGLMLREQDYLKALTPNLKVDYIIGSSHFVDGYDVYDRAYYAGRTEKEAYSRYFEATLERITALDCFDSLGHLDYIVRYGPNKNRDYCPDDYLDIIEPILRTLIKKGKALECNTAGFKHGLGHPHPQEEILTLYRNLGGELLTVGSDSHRPQELGTAFSQTAGLLQACGFRYYTVFHERKPEFVKIR